MEQEQSRQKRLQKKVGGTAVFFCLLLIFVVITALGNGSMETGPKEVIRVIFSKLTGQDPLIYGIKTNMSAVIWEIRLPRILCGVLAGMGLAVAGTIFQAILQNPLADPYTMGISTGAAFGASLAIFSNVMFGTMFSVTFPALGMALITLVLVISLSYRGNGVRTSNMIIAGIIVSSFFSAGISFLKMLAGENVSAIIYWLMGSLSGTDWQDVALLFGAVALAGVPAVFFSRDLNGMALGNRTAQSLGIDVKRTSYFYLILGAVLTAVCVASCGVIGFVGLIVPHLIRNFLSADNRILLPLSGLCGGVLLGASDYAARLIGSGEIPVGVLTTLFGGPFFILVYLHKKGGDRE